MRVPSIPRAALWTCGLLLACGPEGEQILSSSQDAACAASDAALVDGISTGDELIAVFECANAAGQLDPLAPTLYAMQTSADPAGVPLLDLWVSAINQALTNRSGGPTTVALTADDLAAAVSQLAGFMDSGAPQVALNLMAESIDKHLVADALWWMRWMGVGATQMRFATSGPDLGAWLAATQDILCHGGVEPCHSSLERALQGLAAFSTPSTWDPQDPANDDLRLALDWNFYAGGDVRRATEAHEALARSLAALSEPRQIPGFEGERTVLSVLLVDVLPPLAGDDLSTPDVYEGYGSLNPHESALYALTLLLTDPSIREAMTNSSDDVWELVSSYYPGTPGGDPGYATPWHTDTCLDPSQQPRQFGVANNGLDQVLRLLAATDIPYDETPALCRGIFEVALPLAAPVFSFSGDKSIGSVVLELFAQLPLKAVQWATNLLNIRPVVAIANTTCGLNIQYDDTEALQAAVYQVDTMNMALPLLLAITEANQMPPVVDAISALWATPAVCELGPTLRLMFHPEAPQAQGSGSGLDLLPNPSAPAGSTAHDQITVPLIEVAMDLGRHADVLLPPIELALRDGQEELVSLLLDLGRMAHDPSSALGEVGLLSAEISQLDLGGGPVDLGGAASALGDEDLAYALFATLASPEVIDALENGSSQTPISLLDRTSQRVKDGTYDEYLALLSTLLRELDGQLSSDTDTPQAEPLASTQTE